MDARTEFVLRDDATILQVAEIEESLRAELEYQPDDFIVSQLAGRASSTLVDPDTAELLKGFRRPRTIAEAVIRFSVPRQYDPEEVLVAALPFIERCFRRGLLIDVNDVEARELSRQSLEAGDRVENLIVLRPLQILDDCELYQVRFGSDLAAFKIRRADEASGLLAPNVGSLEVEASILEQLSGEIAPELIRRGEFEGRPYLLLEWCCGVDSQTAGAEWRHRESGARSRLLTLCRHIASAYARLHSLGVIHGDVHPRNLLIDQESRIRLIDFACARAPAVSDTVQDTKRDSVRPGVPFYFEPEHARSMLTGYGPMPVSEAGEQFAVAALLYHLVSGVHYCDLGLQRRDLYRRITEAQPVPFEERGMPPWPELETILRQALAQRPADRFPSMTSLADALDRVPEPTAVRFGKRAPAQTTRHELRLAIQDLRHRSRLDGSWLKEGLSIAPTASLSYGAAGIAYALYRIACQRDDPEVLALADIWIRRAEGNIDLAEGFYNSSQGLAAEDLGQVSPYHTPAGIFAVSAMLARARDDLVSLNVAIEAFVTASDQPAREVDLTLGTSGTLLACALLKDLYSSTGSLEQSVLTELGHRSLESLWRQRDNRPPISESADEPLGMAHGWAGFLYATLQWCRTSDAELPGGLENRLKQLAGLAVPVGRGLRWLSRSTAPSSHFPTGWCQGSAGQVFLWTLAARLLDDSSYDELATGAAWDAWDGHELISNLCCGLAGRAYAMLCMYRHTDDRLWLDRAHDLAVRAARERRFESDFPHSLYKGELILAVLAADLERPEDSAMPFFEPEGW